MWNGDGGGLVGTVSGRIRTREVISCIQISTYIYIYVAWLRTCFAGLTLLLYSVTLQCGDVWGIFFLLSPWEVVCLLSQSPIPTFTITAPLSTHFRYTHIYLHITRRQVKVSREKLFGCGCVFSSFGTFDGTYNAIYPLIYASTHKHTHTYKTYIYKIRNNNIFWH